MKIANSCGRVDARAKRRGRVGRPVQRMIEFAQVEVGANVVGLIPDELLKKRERLDGVVFLEVFLGKGEPRERIVRVETMELLEGGDTIHGRLFVSEDSWFRRR